MIMVNVSKLMGLAGEALSAVKRAPMAQKATMAAIFGVGAMTGALINCDGFEKEEAKAPTEQVAKKAMTKPKAEATPLPPLNLSQIGKLCPKIAQVPAIRAAIVE